MNTLSRVALGAGTAVMSGAFAGTPVTQGLRTYMPDYDDIKRGRAGASAPAAVPPAAR